jgi:hypothetical protein
MLTLQESSLNWALAHSLRFGDTDVFPVPFEYEAIQYDWDHVRDYLLQQDILEWKVRPHRMLLSPKAKYGFRVITQLDPLDLLVFAATIKEIAPDIEARRIPVSDNRVFSYRYSHDPDGGLFDSSVGYSQFQSETQRILSESPGITHVATADIADFYSRIYHHRLEGALQDATARASHVSAIRHLLRGWNETETFGIPVGNSPSRLLAEITIADVDQALLANQVNFIRYNDDYRIFADSHSRAYRHIAFLAETLFSSRGLTLQPQKTAVLTTEDFDRRHLQTAKGRELKSLQSRFERLLSALNLSDRYERIEYEDLDEEQRVLVDSLNLVALFRDELDSGREPDLAIIRFALRRLGQLGDDTLVDDVLENLDTLHPAFPDIIRYLQRLRGLSEEQRVSIGKRVIKLLDDSIISELDYHRMWALDLFTHNTEWDSEDRFLELYSRSPDQPSKRKLILAMGRASHHYWFQSQWRRLFEQSPWPRRALLAGASCMPPDSRKHWYRSVESRLDPLEKAVLRWARQNPFGE